MRLVVFVIFNSFIVSSLLGQSFSGIISNKKTGKAIEFVNVGVIGKSIGTVSDYAGNYTISLDSRFDTDSLRVSCIGYYPFTIQVLDYKNLESKNICLKEKYFEIGEVVVHEKRYKEKRLGVKTKSKTVSAGFKDNKLGNEMGIEMKVKKTALIERVYLNIAYCSYDSIFYRLNVYKVVGKKRFENVLEKPIYVTIAKDKINETVMIDLLQYNIFVKGKFMISLEHVKDLGKGYLNFSSSFLHKTTYRETSQAEWTTVPVGVSISADVKEEK